jgi:hypothetical protein
VQAGRAAEDDQIDQRVRTQTVGTVHRNAGRFTNRIKAGDDDFRVFALLGHNLTVIITGNAAHIIVDGRANRQRLAGQIDTGENLAAFGDARQAFCQHLGIDMVEVQVDMVLVRANAATFAHFKRH